MRGNESQKPDHPNPMPVESHRDLLVWQKAMNLRVLVYGLTSGFLDNERCLLVAQLRRSASSVPANIAEGRGRYTRSDFAHFVSVAKGSLMETETFLLLAIRLGYLTEDESTSALCLIAEIAKMLNTLQKRLKTPA